MVETLSSDRLLDAVDTTPAPTTRDYLAVTVALALFGLALYALVSAVPHATVRQEQLLAPIFALVALVALVWLLMVGFRNFAVLRGIARASYFARYSKDDEPPEWVERPTRVFNNLMQVPTLFYAACVLMMITQQLDVAQLQLAWVFVATRVLHAFVYMIWNHLPSRFGSWMAGVITLAVLWTRFALQSWHLLS